MGAVLSFQLPADGACLQHQPRASAGRQNQNRQHHAFFLHFNKSAELMMTNTEPALCTSAPTTGLSTPVIARAMAIKFRVMEKVRLHRMISIMRRASRSRWGSSRLPAATSRPCTSARTPRPGVGHVEGHQVAERHFKAPGLLRHIIPFVFQGIRPAGKAGFFDLLSFSRPVGHAENTVPLPGFLIFIDRHESTSLQCETRN